MRIATVSLAVKLSPAVSLLIALSAFALASPVVAQDAIKADSATPAAKPSTSASDRPQSRAERRQAEAAAKAEGGGKSEDLAKFPKANTATAAKSAPAQPKMECRTQEITGSRMGKRICATPEQWAQSDEAAAEAIRQMKSDVNTKAGITRPEANPFGGAVGR